MSKKKKTIEELLEEALVPEDEQPFQVPGNWVWVRTETANDIVTGSTPAKKQSEYYGGGFPFVKPADLEQGSEVIHASEYLTEKGKAVSRIIPKESTMVCCIGSIGKAGFSTVECTTNQQINSLVPNKKMINPKFNYYQVLNETYQNELWNHSSATTVSIINKGKMSLIPYVLPPFNEQKRIADKVERLLSKIEEAKQLIEEAKESFELRRAAILDKAFRGDLTKKWRSENLNIESVEKLYVDIQNEKKKNAPKKKRTLKEHDPIIEPFILPPTWKWVRLSEICHLIVDGVHKKPDYVEQGIPFVTVKNLTSSNVLSLDDTKFVTEEAHKKFSERTNPEYGDILMSKDGTLGVCRKVDIHTEFSIFVSVALIKTVKPFIDSDYILRILQTPFVQNTLINGSKGTGLKHIHLVDLRNVLVPLPPLEEQVLIAEVVDKLIKKEEGSIANISEVLNSVVKISNSILSKAFRGELGTNDPSEESAIELLKEALQEQVK
ncbi:restriction endonuclease subunit S [Bacillus spizizenii]|uniref:restriction endonuclease subunit S n=1 Tax=Bacillus spizizenii TaxID=96241 RepID=UPI00165B2B7E|nr:restriction endonuclease subunit S [Bacillus spizizenii]MEC1596508.1 restriction endonuclease subunit S [Bacillus spizizenii]MEC1642513.1 restriction endonuclease subunit S [Bacillus spizizenii]